jgi:hypothetical protein
MDAAKKYGKWLLLFMLPWPILIVIALYKSYLIYKEKGKNNDKKSDQAET